MFGMDPSLAATLYLVALLADVVLGVVAGHKLGLKLWKLRYRTGVTSRFGRFATHYIPWALAGGLAMCSVIFVSMVNGLASFMLLGPMVALLMIADALEPPHKACKTCGN